MSSSFLSVEVSNPGCEESFQLPLFSLEDSPFNLSQPPLDIDHFYPSSHHHSHSSHRLSPTAVVPSMYASQTPSPPPSSSTTSVPSASHSLPHPPSTPTLRKKRKKEAVPSPDEPNAGFDWQPYSSPAQDHCIFDQSGLQITEQFDLSMQKVEANTHYSSSDNAWICYRQNQFKVICTLESPHEEGMTCFVSDNGAMIGVSQFCAKLYAIKEINSAVGEEMRVGLHHVGKSRVKKEKLDIAIAPFINGRIEFANVQFERSNAVKGQQLEYFHLVLAFYAKSFSNTFYHIFSRVSMRLIVRSQNPGFYGDHPALHQAETHEDTSSNKSSSPSGSPGSSHDSVPSVPPYTPHPPSHLSSSSTQSHQPNNSFQFNSTPNSNFSNTNPHEFAMHSNNMTAPPPPFQFQPHTISNPPPFIPMVGNPNAPNNVNNVNNVTSSLSNTNSFIRMNSTNINTTTTDIYPNYNSNSPPFNSTNNTNNNTSSFHSSNTTFIPPATFGRDTQSNAGVPWKTEGGPSNGSAPGPSSLRASGGGGGGGGGGSSSSSGGGGSGSGGSGSDGNRGGGMGEPAWQQFSDVVVHHGRVGINTFTPLEALTVNGNVLVTGNVFKPSDMRIKSDITAVDSGSQLSNVRNLKIYDYVVRSQQERGVLAQELQAVIPQAVNDVGDVDNIPNFLVINERVLLFENIGATQQLDKELESEKQTIVEIDSRVAELKQTTAQENLEVKNKIRNLFDVLFAEESGDRMMLAGLEEEYLNIGFSVFKMGPPRSFFLVGFLFPFSWSLGALYVFSNISSRRIMGFSNLLMLISFLVLYFCTEFDMVDRSVITKVQITWVGAGIVLLLINYARMRSRLKKKMKQMDKERNKKKAHITKQIDEVTQKNLDKLERNEKRSKRKEKEKADTKYILEVAESIILQSEREELTKKKGKKSKKGNKRDKDAGAVLHVPVEIETCA